MPSPAKTLAGASAALALVTASADAAPAAPSALLERPGLATGTDEIFGVKPPGLAREPRPPAPAERIAELRRTARDPAPPPAPATAFPVAGPVSVGDGLHERPGGHDGVDLMADCGLPLRAMRAGTAWRVAEDGAAGRHVVLRGHAGDEVYMHLQDVDVREGQRVRAGQRLGTVGDTGNATACHLHLERWAPPGWHAGALQDPEPALRRARRGATS